MMFTKACPPNNERTKKTYKTKGMIPIDIHPVRVAIGQLYPISGLGQMYGWAANVNASVPGQLMPDKMLSRTMYLRRTRPCRRRGRQQSWEENSSRTSERKSALHRWTSKLRRSWCRMGSFERRHCFERVIDS